MPAGPEDRGPFYKTPSSGSIYDRLRAIINDLGGTVPPPVDPSSGPFYKGPTASDVLAALAEIEEEAAAGGGGPGGAVATQRFAKFSANGTFDVPDDTEEIIVTILGAGSGGAGGGGGSGTGAAPGGGSGGFSGTSGYMVRRPFAVTPGETLDITIGQGGAGGAGGNGGNNAVGGDGTMGADGGATIVDGAVDSMEVPGADGQRMSPGGVTRAGLGGQAAAGGAAPSAGLATNLGGFPMASPLFALADVTGANGTAGTSHANGGGGGAGGQNQTARGVQLQWTRGQVGAAGQVGAVYGDGAASRSGSISVDPFNLGVTKAGPGTGGDGGNGNAAGGLPGEDGEDGPMGCGGGGGGGGGGSAAGNIGGNGGSGGDGGDGFVLIEYWSAT